MGVFLQKCFKQFGDLLATFVTLELHHRLSGRIIDSPNAVLFVRLPRCVDHHLLSFRTPHGLQDGEPADIKLVGVVEDLAWLQAISRGFNRLFFYVSNLSLMSFSSRAAR